MDDVEIEAGEEEQPVVVDDVRPTPSFSRLRLVTAANPAFVYNRRSTPSGTPPPTSSLRLSVATSSGALVNKPAHRLNRSRKLRCASRGCLACRAAASTRKLAAARRRCHGDDDERAPPDATRTSVSGSSECRCTDYKLEASISQRFSRKNVYAINDRYELKF